MPLSHPQIVLATTNKIRFLRGSRAQLKVWNAGEPIPEADVTLCLNMLHHVKDPAAAIAEVRSPILITEMPERGDDGQDLMAACLPHFADCGRYPSTNSKRLICVFRR